MILDLLIELGWKSALVCGVALGASLALRGRPAAQRVAMLRAGVAALLLLPLLVLTVPVLEIAVLPASVPLPELGATPELATVAMPIAVSPAPAPAIDWLALLYAAGGALLVLRLALGLLLLHRWTRHAVPASNPVWLEVIARAAEPLRRPVRLLVSPRVASPLSLGVAPATILIGPDTERASERAAAVIAHEMAHVRALDWPVMLATRIALALFWFNPLAWLLAAELARQTELAADEEAVTRVARTDYAQALLAVAGGCGAHSACGMAVTRSALGKRILRVLDAAPRKPASGLLCATLICSIPLGIAPLAAMQLVPGQSAPVPAPAAKLRAPEPVTEPTSAATPQAAAEKPKPRRVAPKRGPSLAEKLETPPASASEPQGLAGFKSRFEAKMARWRMSMRETAKPAKPSTESIGLRLAKAELAAPGPAKLPPARTVWGAGPDVRSQVAQRMAVASQLRAEAQNYRNQASDAGLSPEIRESYVKVAEALRSNAEQLEKQAKQMKTGF
jgi:beta-lactamase regulating signal transducer with metallopeptidase domain